MAAAGDKVVDSLILMVATTYTVVALCHSVAMWNMRKNFFVALRSPHLACPSGAMMTIFYTFKVYVYVLGLNNQPPDGVIFYAGSYSEPWVEIVFLVGDPAVFLASMALIAWAIRLLVLYDPAKLRRWGHRTKETVMLRAFFWLYAAIQMGAWLAVPFYGLQAVSYYTMVTLDIIRELGTLVAVVLLARPLRRMNDLNHLSRDGLLLGALKLTSIVVHSFLWSFDWSPRVFKYLLIGVDFLSAQPIVYTINIKPVRDFVRHNQGQHTTVASWMSAGLVGNNHNSAVACTNGHTKSVTRRTNIPRNPLVQMMDFLPLRLAFGEFCRKALCSESFQFLVDVSDFHISVRAFDGKDDFEQFLAIVNKYIKDCSTSEINIDHRTKEEILHFSDRDAYTSLPAEDRMDVFRSAETEISKMLAENLLSKFKATKEYKELVGELVFFEAN